MAKQRNEEEIAATVRELPIQPPEGTVDVLRKRDMLKCDYLVYSCEYVPDLISGKKEKKVKVFCTCCNSYSYLEYVHFESGCSRGASIYSYGFVDPADNHVKKNASTCVCPSCGKGLTALHISHIQQSYELDRAFCVSVHNVRGHLCLLSWTVGKYVRKNMEIFYRSDPWEGDLIVDGSFIRVCGYEKNFTQVRFYGGWEQRVKGIDGIGNCSRIEILNFTKKDIESTDSTYCALYEYIAGAVGKDRYPGAYLQLWCKYPQVENLIRQGYSRFVNDVLADSVGYFNNYGCGKVFRVTNVSNHINFKTKKPLEMLSVTKEESYIPKTYKLEIFHLYREIKEKLGIALDQDTLSFIESNCSAYSVRDFVFNHDRVHGYKVPILRSLHYLARQVKDLPKAEGNRVSCQLLVDYWNYVYRVYGCMQHSELYPKNLVRAHDNFVAKIKEKEDAELDSMFENRFQELSYMAYSSMELGLMIRPCKTQKEIIDEGKKLSHCVGGYKKDHASGKTNIFFVRKIENPSVPFYTLEYKNGRIIQDHGYKNKLQTEEVKAFEKEWLSFLEKNSLNKGVWNGKSSTNREHVLAGA